MNIFRKDCEWQVIVELHRDSVSLKNQSTTSGPSYAARLQQKLQRRNQ